MSTTEGVAMQIEGVPDSITREAVSKIVEALGMDPSRVRALRIHSKAIEADVYAVNAEGKKFIADDAVGPAVHTVCIPIV